MKFLLDENTSLLATERLREAGHDAIHVTEAGLAGKSDTEVFAVSQAEGRMLVTRDHHFSNPARFPLEGTYGVVHLRARKVTSVQEAQLLVALTTSYDLSKMAGRLVRVTAERVTIR